MIIARAVESKKDFKLVPAGLYLARCYRIVDLGTQVTVFQGKEKSNRKVLISFEMHDEDQFGNPLVTDKGDPLSISKNYTLMLAELATLRKDLKSWRGRDLTKEELKGFQLSSLLDEWAELTIAHKPGSDGRTYANIDTVNPVSARAKKAGIPAGHNKPVIFSIDSPDMEIFESFSDGIKAKIERSPEWQALMSYAPVPVRRPNPAPQQTSRPAAPAAEFEEDDIPF
jgi:hypothetical protein